MKNSKIVKGIIGFVIICIASISIWIISEAAVANSFNGSKNTQKNDSAVTNTNENLQISKVNEASINDLSSSENTFTLEELSKYNGQNGEKSYIGVYNKVYDMTNVNSWSNGVHMGLEAGQVLTQEFEQSPHVLAILEDAPMVGVLVSQSPVVQNTDNSKQAVVETSDSQSNNSILVEDQPTAQGVTSDKTWTLNEVSKYNGKNGNPSYILVNNTIYDVSNVSGWSGGSHKGVEAGRDLTQAFASSPHSQSILKQARVVGSIGDVINNTNSIVNNSGVSESVSDSVLIISDEHNSHNLNYDDIGEDSRDEEDYEDEEDED